MSRSPEGEAEAGFRKKSLCSDQLLSAGRLTAVVLQHLLSDHGVAVAASHQVGRQHHRVDLLLLDGFVVRDPTSGADDAEAPQATPRRSGDVELHVETCWKASRRQWEEPGSAAHATELPRRVPGGETPGAEPSKLFTVIVGGAESLSDLEPGWSDVSVVPVSMCPGGEGGASCPRRPTSRPTGLTQGLDTARHTLETMFQRAGTDRTLGGTLRCLGHIASPRIRRLSSGWRPSAAPGRRFLRRAGRRAGPPS